MRRRNSKKPAKQDADFSPQGESDSHNQEEKDHYEIQEQPGKKRSKERKIRRKDNKAKLGSKSKSLEMSEDSANSEIVEIRDGDENLREHIRPQFLKRWDGIQNQLQISVAQYESMSPMLCVYWRTKSRNMRAVVFLQFGGMEYFAFENDAIMLSELTKKRLKKFSKYLMVNFWCKEIEDVKRQLFHKRTPVLIMNEVEDPQYRRLHGIIKREIVEVITPALHPSMDASTQGRERLLMALYKEGESFSLVLLDGQTNHVCTEQIQEDKYLHEVRRAVNRYRPVEVLLPHRGHDDISTITRQICDPYIVELKQEDTADLSQLLEDMLRENRCAYLLALRDACRKDGSRFSRYRTVLALALLRQYLNYLSLKEKVFHHVIFDQRGPEQFRPPFFDSQVYENLELFRLNQSEEESYGQRGTLLHYVDHCRTQQGRKLLHGWLDCPPAVLPDVLERQQAVTELLQQELPLKLHDRLIAFQKLGKQLGDVYHWVERDNERGKIILTKGINFEKDYDQGKNPAVLRLKEIIHIAQLLKEYELFLKQLAQRPFKAALLRKYTQLRETENLHKATQEELSAIQGVPELSYVANAVLSELSYDPVSGHLQPSPGQSEVFDENKREFERIQECLRAQLAKWSQFFGSSKVQFVSVRAKNEIQVPKTAIKTSGKTNPHADLIFSSEVAGAVRYVTAETSALSMEQVGFQEAMAQAYEPFLQKILHEFCRYRYLWDTFLTSSAWVDALLSLARASSNMGVRCLPVFREQGLLIKAAVHPSLSQVLQSTVPNDLCLQQEQKALIVTGPNMGGKSTLLKQTCLLAVLAQLGCFVPAREYVGPVFDQIFCRMGACDRIHEGKSTFYVQLQETKRILSKGTSRSLVVIDELGRGTSTYDGMAIAEAVLDHLVFVLKPITLFSTHYSQITQRYANCPQVKLAKMAHEIDEGRLRFTYQLAQGVAEKSFACNVARIVAIPTPILLRAQHHSTQMHHQTNRKNQLREACRLAGLLTHPPAQPPNHPPTNANKEERFGEGTQLGRVGQEAKTALTYERQSGGLTLERQSRGRKVRTRQGKQRQSRRSGDK